MPLRTKPFLSFPTRMTPLQALTGLLIVVLILQVWPVTRSNDDPAANLWPAVGDELSWADIETAFQLDRRFDGDVHWVLALTSSCPWCLAMEAELDSIRRAARCAGARLVPLIIDLDGNTDSIRSVLAQYDLKPAGVSSPHGFFALSVRAVPSVLEIDGTGRVLRVMHPGAQGWPPSPGC